MMCGLLEFSISELLHHQYLRLQIAVGEMEPVEIVGVVLVRGWERELAITVHVDDVFGAGGETGGWTSGFRSLMAWEGENRGALVQG